MLKACLNGIRRPGSHPALPATPAQLAAAAMAAGDAGAAAVHLHVKDENGADTFDGGRLAAVLEAVRPAVPTMPIGISTAASAVASSVNRFDAIASWTMLPDFASVNWHEPHAEAVAGALLDRGVEVEAGLWHRNAIRTWQDSLLRGHCLRVLIELGDLPDRASVRARAEQLLDALGLTPGDPALEGTPVLLHGKERSAWPALSYAVARGLDTRIGLEDVLVLPDGSAAPDNAALVEAARSLGAR